jgi:hypothetical protein
MRQHAVRSNCRRSNVDLFCFAISCSCRLESDPGSARLAKNDRLSSGIGPGPFQGRPATNQCIAEAEVMLLYGHSGTNPLSTIACRPDLQTIRNQPLHRLKFLVQYIARAREYAVLANDSPALCCERGLSESLLSSRPNSPHRLASGLPRRH